LACPPCNWGEYSDDLIAENLYGQCKLKGHYQLVFKEIVDHRKGPTAILKEAGYTIGYNGNKHMKKQQKDVIYALNGATAQPHGFCSRMSSKQANLLKLAKYEQANKI